MDSQWTNNQGNLVNGLLRVPFFFLFSDCETNGGTFPAQALGQQRKPLTTIMTIITHTHPTRNGMKQPITIRHCNKAMLQWKPRVVRYYDLLFTAAIRFAFLFLFQAMLLQLLPATVMLLCVVTPYGVLAHCETMVTPRELCTTIKFTRHRNKQEVNGNSASELENKKFDDIQQLLDDDTNVFKMLDSTRMRGYQTSSVTQR